MLLLYYTGGDPGFLRIFNVFEECNFKITAEKSKIIIFIEDAATPLTPSINPPLHNQLKSVTKCPAVCLDGVHIRVQIQGSENLLLAGSEGEGRTSMSV